MTFKDKKYLVIKNAVSKEIANFTYAYLLLKRDVARTLFDRKWISPFEEIHGEWGDEQIPETFSIYGDVAMETLLLKLLPMMEKETGIKLVPTYSYARIYKKGDELKRHKDRQSCEISTTLNLGGDPWPIYLSPNENVGVAEENGGKKGITNVSKAKGIKIDLKPGDMLVYPGCIFEHWREPFTKKNCGQVFLHYNSESSKENNKFDERLHLGLPKDIKR